MKQSVRSKIMVFGISSLDDARYFSARMVDYFVFDLRTLTIEEVQEITDWVEGPETLILISPASADLFEEAVMRLKPEGVFLDQISADLVIPFFEESRIVSSDLLMTQRKISYDGIEFSVHNIEQNLQTGKNLVLTLKGSLSGEDYDKLDELFDALDEMQ